MPAWKLAIVVSHPIQHFVPLYRELAARPEIDLKVFFCSRVGADAYFDKDMGTEIAWAGSLLDGFPHEILPEAPQITEITAKSVDNPSVTAALERFGPDAVIIYGYVQRTPHRARRWAAARNIPVLMISDTNAVIRRPFVKEVARRIILSMIFRDVAGFLSPGDQNEDQLALLGQPRSKLFRSPFPIDEARYRAVRAERSGHRRDVRAEHGLAPDAFVAVAVGKLVERKRPQDAIRAVAAAARTDPRVHLVICGNGPLLVECEALANALDAPVTFAGFVNVDRLPSYFAAADVLLHPAAEDPHPLICSEAAAMGLPMVLSDKVGTIGATDVARRDVNTIVVPCGEVDGFAGALLRLLGDRALYARMAAASLACFDDNDIRASVRGVLQALGAVAPRSVS